MPLQMLANAKVSLSRARYEAAVLVACALMPAIGLIAVRVLDANGPIALGRRTTILLFAFAGSSVLLSIFLGFARLKISRMRVEQAVIVGTAAIDSLSQLPNRRYFEMVAEAAVAASSAASPVALIAIDVDRFKSINDSHGHAAGDRLIVSIAERVRGVMGEGDCLARLGGDEFALLLTDAGGAARCASTAHRIMDAMRAPVEIGSAQVHVTLSLGVALGPLDGLSLSALREAADLALYRAKREGRNRFAFFDKTMEQKLQLGVAIADDLRDAIGTDALSIVYQPLMMRCGRRMRGVEALVRWTHPKLGTIAPDDFIPLAESRGHIVALGEWVLRQACSDAKRWPDLRMAINVSPVQFRQRNFVAMVKDVLASTGIDPARLDLEITEGVLIQDAEQAEAMLMELRALGLRIGLDDFGSGYSSLIYLRRFPFDKIKIDRAFLGSLEPHGEGAIILEYIVSLGHALGLTVTAEGVEHAEQLEFLQKLGCDELQGFVLSPPLPPDEIDELVSMASWEAGTASADPMPTHSAAAA